MRCSYCQSENTTSKIIKSNKSTRNFLVCFITFITVICLITIMGVFANVTLLSFFVGFIIAIPISLFALIISCFIPVKDKVIFVCNECGKITKV